MATNLEYGCPTCGRKFFGPVAPLVPGSDPLPANHCCGRTWDFHDCARFQWDPLTEMRALSVLTQEEQMRELPQDAERGCREVRTAHDPEAAWAARVR